MERWDSRSVEYKTYETNHMAHAVLTFVSLGGWAPIWFAVSVYNMIRRWRR